MKFFKGKIKSIIAFSVLGICVIASAVLSYLDYRIDVFPTDSTQIRLYGEYHGIKSYYVTEYELWKGYYDEGYRDLFIELPYYTAEFLNIWMKENDDSILDQLYIDLQGTASGNEDDYLFFKDIKANCPGTVFHGIDVGHQYGTTGLRYLEYLEQNDLKDSPEYAKAIECIIQGEEFYADDSTYDGLSLIRENYMVGNFIEAYDSTDGKVMGIFGSDHTRSDKPHFLFCKLRDHYGDNISTVRISTVIYSANDPYALGFSAAGLFFVIMLFVPGFIRTKIVEHEGHEESPRSDSQALLLLDHCGEIALIISLLVFPSVNLHIRILPEGIYSDWRIIMWVAAFVLVILYECYWIKFFRSPKTIKDLCSSFAGYPLAGATLPFMVALLLGLYSLNIIIVVCSVIFGIGRIGNYIKYRAA